MRASIVLVDDDVWFCRSARRALEAAGHSVREAADGDQALSLIQAEAPAVLITDIVMPNTDGIGLIRAVKRDYPDVRVLAISGRGLLGGLDVLKLARKVGADRTMTKPLCQDQLLAEIAELMVQDPDTGPASL